MKPKFFYIAVLMTIALAGLSACNDNNNKDGATAESQEIMIGALLPLTGMLAEKGEASLAVMNLAIDDFNAYLQAQNAGKTVKLVYEDTETSPVVVGQKIEDLAAQGIRLVVGPMTSENLSEVKPYAEEMVMVLISQSSTATSLSVDDNIFRLVPDDAVQARAIADLMIHDGREAVVFIYRDDEWGNGLVAEVSGAFEKLGGTVIGQVGYRQKLEAEEQDELISMVNQAIGTYGEDGVAIQLASFSEGSSILYTLSSDATLSSLAWYGGDGLTRDSGLISDAIAAQFAADVSLMSPAFHENDSTEYINIKERAEQQLGSSPDIFAMIAYDAVRIACLALTGDGDTENDLKGVVSSVASGYEGITGTIQLNAAGDRLSGAYDFWTVSDADGTYEWVRALTWDNGTITDTD